MIANISKGLDKILSLILGDILEIPFAGTPISTIIIGSCPEAHFHLLARVGTGVASHGIFIVLTVMAQLMDIVATAPGLAGKTDIEDILLEVFFVVLNKIISRIVEYHVGSIISVGGHDKTVLVRRREADIGIHTGILNQDAVAMLGELPNEVSPIPVDSSVNALIKMIGTDRSR